MGPPGCGKTQHGINLAQKFKLQYVKVKHMINDLIRSEGPKSAKAKMLRDSLSNGDPSIFNLFNFAVPDDIIISLVKDRLGKQDC